MLDYINSWTIEEGRRLSGYPHLTEAAQFEKHDGRRWHAERWAGCAAPVLTGSHTDAIPLSGAYDGTLGVVGGIAAVKALKEAGFKPQRSIEVVMFTSEEPTRFGLSCLGRCAPLPPPFVPFLSPRRLVKDPRTRINPRKLIFGFWVRDWVRVWVLGFHFQHFL